MDPAELAALYGTDGDYATIYLDTTSNVENAGPKLELRWKNVLRELENSGVDETTRDALSAARGEHWEGGTRVLVGAGGQAVLATSIPGPPARESVHVGPLPHLLPLLDRLALQLPHLVVLTDRQGADILAYAKDSQGEPAETATVIGDAPDITKVHAGGWAERRYQARVEEGWQHNAKEVAELIDGVARDVDPRLIVTAGDVRALGLVHDNLAERLKPLWTVVPGGRTEDGSAESVARHVREAVDARVADDLVELLRTYAEQLGQAQLASAGVAQTMAALRRGQVDVLLIAADTEESTTAFFGAEPTAIGMRPDDVTGVGAATAREGPLVDVLVRAALCTGARVAVVPAGAEPVPKDGVGAVLRFTTA